MLIKKKFILKIYLFILSKFVKPKIIWLYGGGLLAARILENRELFSCDTKFVVRSMGSDVQYDKVSKYGTKPGSAKYIYMTSMYKKANFLWALSEEIEDIYKKDIKGFKGNITICGNSIWKPAIIKKTQNKNKINIGLIGRNHPKKNFELMNQIIRKLDLNRYNIYFKTPGFRLKKNYPNVYYEPKTNITNLIYWPPLDVWEFYHKIDILLVLSKVESFGNVTFEAGLSGCSIIINEKTTGADLAKRFDFPITSFKNFTQHDIVKAISSVKIRDSKSKNNSINVVEQKKLIGIVCND